MKVKLVNHTADVAERFAIFVGHLVDAVNDFYDRGDWILAANRDERRTYNLLEYLASAAFAKIAKHYMPNTGQADMFFDNRLAIVTRRTALADPAVPMKYPVGYELIHADIQMEMEHVTEGEASDLMHFWRSRVGVFDKIQELYGYCSPYLNLQYAEPPPFVLNLLLVKDILGSITSGIQHPQFGMMTPPATLCISKRVSDLNRYALEKANGDLTGIDLVLIPVTPDSETLDTVLDQLLFTE